MKTFDKSIKVGVVYNAFDPTQVQKSELVWRKGAKLKTYLKDLPSECEWKIGVNGKPVTLKDNGDMRLKPTDTLQLVVIPHGGDGFKDILRMVAMIALAVAVSVLLPGIGLSGVALYAASAAVTIAGSLLINALLPPKAPKMDSDSDSASYGYDGAKNTSKEGIAVPVVYGKYRVAGNYVDAYTQNVGDDQYLYGRCVLSEGQVSNVSSPLFNEQEPSNYKELTWGFTKGTPTDTVVPYFNRNISQVQKGIKLSTSWTTHTTLSEVDQLSINLQFPRGLCNINDKGKKQTRNATVEIQISEHGANDWQPFGANYTIRHDGAQNPVTEATAITNRLQVEVTPAAFSAGLSDTYSYDIQYKKAADSTWTTYKSVERTTSAISYTPDTDGDWGTVQTGNADYYPVANTETHYIDIDDPDQYNMRVIATGPVSVAMSAWGYNSIYAPASYTFSDNRIKVIRKTVESGSLTPNQYDVRIRKTSADGDNEKAIDELYLIDVGEILNSNITLRNVATGYYAIKMTEQLSGIPNTTWLVDGVECRHYDANGDVTSTTWTDNPAWIILDMLIGEERGAPGIYAIDFPAFVDWAEHCEANGLKFNGIFDTTQTLWDACVDVLKVGHASFSRIGTKLSLAIDRETQPVMLFGPGNIFKDSFAVNYLPMSDRANEFEVSYFDREDQNKQKTIRIVDAEANNRGDLPRAVSYSLLGIDNFEQAQKEVWYQLYSNRYLRRSVSFDAPIESIALGIGDVALIQHDMMDWGVSGRLASGSTSSTIKLDRNVLMESGSDYALLVTHDKLVTATGYKGTEDYWTGVTWTGDEPSLDNVKYMYQPSTGIQVEVFNLTNVGSGVFEVNYYGTLAGSDPSDIWEFVADVDVIEERDVEFDDSGELDTIVLSSPFSQAPNQYSNFMFGVKEIVKKPYRLKSMSGTGYDRRTLTFLEYNPAIYNEPDHIVPQPPTTLPKTVTHVTDVQYTYDLRSTQTNTNIRGVLSWNAKSIRNYGGVDIYVSLNDADWVFNKTILNATETQLDFQLGDNVKIKVVAFNNTLVRANIGTAPYTEQDILSGPSFLDPPTDLVITPITTALAMIEVTWDAPISAGTDPVRYRAQVKLSGKSVWDEYGVTSETFLRIGDLPSGTHDLRIRTEFGDAYSTWLQDDFTLNSSNSRPIDDFLDDFDDLLAGGAGDITPPAVPTSLNATSSVATDALGYTKTFITATWNTVADADFAYYDFQIKEASNAYESFPTSLNTYTFEAKPGVAYKVKINAVDQSGNKSSFTSEFSITAVSDTTAPSAPSSFTIEAAFTSVFLKWTNPSAADTAQVEIWENTTNNSGTATKIATIPVGPSVATTYVRTGLDSGSTYYYWLKAKDTSGNTSVFSSGANVTTEKLTTIDFPVDVRPIERVTSLPTAGNAGRIVFLTTDNKLYRDTGSVWTKATDGGDISSGTVTGTQLANTTIDVSKFVSGLRPIETLATLPAAGTAGRIVYLTTDSKLYRDTGSAWTAAVPAGDVTGTLTNSQIADLAAAKITGTLTNAQIADLAAAKLTGQITTTQIADNGITTPKIAAGAVVAAKIAASAITAEKLSIGSAGQNLIMNPTGGDDTISGWATGNAVGAPIYTAGNFITTGRRGFRILKASTSDAGYMESRAFPVVPGKVYVVRIRHYSQVAASSGLYLRMYYATALGATGYLAFDAAPGLGYAELVTPNSSMSTTPTLVETTWTCPAGMAYASLTAFNYPSGALDWRFGDVEVFEQKAGAIELADGIITTPKLVAGAVTAAKITAGTITSNEIAASTITATNIAAGTITSNKIAAGAIEAGNIAASAVTANKLAITSFAGGALNMDPGFQDPTAWAQFGSVTFQGGSSGPAGPREVVITSPIGTVSSAYIPLDRTKTYRFRTQCYGAGQVYAGIALTDASGANIAGDGTYWAYIAAGATPGAVWTKYEGQFGANTARTFPSNAASMAVILLGNYNGAGPSYFQDARIDEVIGGTLVVDGTITASKIAANTITASQIAAGTITGDRIVAGAITAGLIASSAITTDKLAVGARGQNLVGNGDGSQSTESWLNVGTGTFTANTGFFGPSKPNFYLNKTLTSDISAVVSRQFPVNPGKTYVFRAKTAGSSNTANGLYLRIMADASSTSNPSGYIGVSHYDTYTDWIANGPYSTITTQHEFTWTCPSGVNFASIWVYNYVAGPLTTGFTDVEFFEQSTSVVIADGAITTTKMTANSINGDRISAGTLDAGKITAATITATQIAANTITAGKIAAGTITATEIAATTITGGKIAAATITGTNISAGTITATHLSVTSLAAITATIGTLRTATTGARMEIHDNVIKCFDASNVVVLKFGDLSL